jgi:hypothetical protein
MKTMMLAAVAALAIGAGTANADNARPSDGSVYRTATPAQQLRDTDHAAPASNTYTVQSQTNEAWQFRGLNGGGG